ncbi:MAG: hypothetical protein Tp136SUR676911_63 [Prokaryotic dsDNA virus sp.]|nr:MAG: hypothetical protein Tp136SUR676911_63 [Prokaryotic dsDNA virus sp.]
MSVTSLTVNQPALIASDAHGEPVVIPAAELRFIARGHHDTTPSQQEAMAAYIINQLDEEL